MALLATDISGDGGGDFVRNGPFDVSFALAPGVQNPLHYMTEALGATMVQSYSFTQMDMVLMMDLISLL